MKKMLVVLLAMFLSLGCASAGLAQIQASAPGGEAEVFESQMAMANTISFEGVVLSHDVMCHCIVVKTASGNLTLQDDYAKFQLGYNRLKGIKIGSTVKGEYKTVNFISYLLWVAYK